jgi:hypothetical protein
VGAVHRENPCDAEEVWRGFYAFGVLSPYVPRRDLHESTVYTPTALQMIANAIAWP